MNTDDAVYAVRLALLRPLALLLKLVTGTNFSRPAARLFALCFGEYRFHGVRLLFPRGERTSRHTGGFFFHAYEKQERILIERHLLADDRVLELGGCLGFIANLTHRRLSPAARAVHTVVEANPAMVDYLERNRTLNDARYRIIGGIVGDEPARLHLHGVDFLGSRLTAAESDDGRGHGELVPATSYGQLPGAAQYDVWIMDIEGGEFDFISRHRQRLDALRMLVVEWHDGEAADPSQAGRARELLRQAGLAPVDRLGPVEVWKRQQRAMQAPADGQPLTSAAT